MSKIKRMIVFIFVVLILLTFSIIAISGDDNDSFNFAVLGDRTDDAHPNVFKNILSKVNDLNVDIVLDVGDHIQGYTDDVNQLQKEFTEVINILKKSKSKYYYTIGNHDKTPRYSEIMEAEFEKYFGRTQYTFSYKNTYFVMFDSTLWWKIEKLPKEQFDWLENALKNKPKNAENIFVFMHIPYWFDYVGVGREDKMHELFKKYKVSAVFNGHLHRYCSGEYDGIKYIMLGSSGGITNLNADESNGTFYQYMTGSVKGKEIKLELISYPSGKKYKWDFITRESLLKK